MFTVLTNGVWNDSTKKTRKQEHAHRIGEYRLTQQGFSREVGDYVT